MRALPQELVGKVLGDTEDSFYTFSPPALRNQPPAINANEMFVQLLGSYIVAPRCILPVGAQCKDDSSATGDSTTKAGGRKKPTRSLRDGGPEGPAFDDDMQEWEDDPMYDQYSPHAARQLVQAGSGAGRRLATRGGRAVVPQARFARRLGAAEDEEAAESCIEGTALLYSTEVQFIRFETTIIVCT